jgi:dipeptidyl aminopeptidase/acylaminoacyl peptidase
VNAGAVARSGSARRLFMAAVALCLALAAGPVPAQVDVDAFVRHDLFTDIEISPNGEYFAATSPRERSTALVIIRRSDRKAVNTIDIGDWFHVQDFWWANDERLLFTIGQRFGRLDQPLRTGEILAADVASGRKAEILVGARARGAGLGSKKDKRKREEVAAWMVDPLPNDDRAVLIGVSEFGDEPLTRVERMDVYTGERTPVTRVPLFGASFAVDPAGVPRFAFGDAKDDKSRLYYRASADAAWTMIHDEAATGRTEMPVGFSADGKTAYLQVEHETGPDSVVAFDVASGTRREVLRDPHVDPNTYVYETGAGGGPVGAHFVDGLGRIEFFDKATPRAKLQRSLEAAFPGQRVHVTSATKDGKVLLVSTSSPRNPGDFYLFDTVAKKADLLVSRSDWLDPAKMGEVRPIAYPARDGLAIRGYLTLPPGSAGKSLPTIVLPHGGPFWVYDTPAFDHEAQLLAQAGYAVLKVNFRGSGNQGRAFAKAGAREWGGKMQDDLTDATRWLVAQGIADPQRICLYGASYGAYAALMGLAREPDLYKCAIGYVGVYDLPKLVEDGVDEDDEDDTSAAYFKEWLGEGALLAERSPTRLAAKIKAPVLLSAGGQDFVAPIGHSKLMAAALKKAGVPVETHYYPYAGHGYAGVDDLRDHYVNVLDFLARHLGGARAAPKAKDKDDE